MRKICILGSAPSSVRLAPYGDPEYSIWGCSPGVFAVAPRSDTWFELHRWEPPVIGKADQQVPWFSPEYTMFMARHPKVWMAEAVPEIPNSHRLPVEDLTAKYGTYFFTSSIAFMLACAIEDILEDRASTGDMGEISLFGVDMAANEEYGYQRAGCQHFITLAQSLGINIVVPPESDLLRPMPLYGIAESSHWMIKLTSRKRELEQRLAQANNKFSQARTEVDFLNGALDDLNYHMNTWSEDRVGHGTSPDILLQMPVVGKHTGDAVIEVMEAMEKKYANKRKPRKKP